MPKDIFYIAKEMCSECWNQLSKTIERIENNNIDNIKDLLFYQYDNKNQIKPIAKKAISIIKCNNKFYALFSKQDLVKQKQTFF
ncbi:hypothetical protein [Spiroplasma endosymbiont of Stenodema calcarata]|uniref:hypothetical protein n=1 Tax=Spiroplasma endosymbiont of Stenodema calcarata TaxID=3139328 RepID=UPI003CCB736B